MVKSKLTPKEEESIKNFLKFGRQEILNLMDSVSWWDGIPYEETHVRYFPLKPRPPHSTQYEMLLRVYLRLSHTSSWAWDNLKKLLAELQLRQEPIPPLLQGWANAVVLGQSLRPESGPGRKRKWDRDFRFVLILQHLRTRGYSWQDAIDKIASLMNLSSDAVKLAVRKFGQDLALRVKKPTQLSPLDKT